MTATMDLPATSPSTDKRQRALEERVVLFSPSMGFWEGRYQLPKKLIDTTAQGDKITKAITTPRTVLLNPECPVDDTGEPWLRRLRACVTRKNKIVNRYSVPFPIKGVRIIPRAKSATFFRELFGKTLYDLQVELEDAKSNGPAHTVDRLQARIDSIKEEDPAASALTPVFDPNRDTQSVAYDFYRTTLDFVSDLSGIYKQIEDYVQPFVWAFCRHRLPKSAGAMRQLFHFGGVPVAIKSTEADEVTMRDLEQYQALIREACQRKVNEAIETIVRGPLEEFLSATDDLVELVNRGGRITAASYKPVRAALEKVRMFDVAPADIMERLQKVEDHLANSSPEDLRTQERARENFTRIVTSAVGEIRNSQSCVEAIREFGKQPRQLDWDD